MPSYTFDPSTPSIISNLMQQQQGNPAVPPNAHAKLPPAVERWDNGQKIQQAYANNWSPNPVLLRALLGRH